MITDLLYHKLDLTSHPFFNFYYEIQTGFPEVDK